MKGQVLTSLWGVTECLWNTVRATQVVNGFQKRPANQTGREIPPLIFSPPPFCPGLNSRKQKNPRNVAQHFFDKNGTDKDGGIDLKEQRQIKAECNGFLRLKPIYQVHTWS